MPESVTVTVAWLDTKQGGDVEVTGGVYGWTVPGRMPRHWVAWLVAVRTIGGCVPGLHEVVAIGAVQSANWISIGVEAFAVWLSGRNTTVGEKSSLPSLLPSVVSCFAICSLTALPNAESVMSLHVRKTVANACGSRSASVSNRYAVG